MNRKFIYIGCTVFAMSLFHAGGIQAQEENKDSLVNVAFGTVAQEDLTHAISTVNTSELTKKVNSSSSLVGLESLIGGYTGNVWGQEALVLVDGVPRSASNVRASEIESVSGSKPSQRAICIALPPNVKAGMRGYRPGLIVYFNIGKSMA